MYSNVRGDERWEVRNILPERRVLLMWGLLSDSDGPLPVFVMPPPLGGNELICCRAIQEFKHTQLNPVIFVISEQTRHFFVYFTFRKSSF